MRNIWHLAPCYLGVDRCLPFGVMILIITMMTETVRISETSVYSNETSRRYIPEGSHLHTVSIENLKSTGLLFCQMIYEYGAAVEV
jgi:hypothetical protein